PSTRISCNRVATSVTSSGKAICDGRSVITVMAELLPSGCPHDVRSGLLDLASRGSDRVTVTTVTTATAVTACGTALACRCLLAFRMAGLEQTGPDSRVPDEQPVTSHKAQSVAVPPLHLRRTPARLDARLGPQRPGRPGRDAPHDGPDVHPGVPDPAAVLADPDQPRGAPEHDGADPDPVRVLLTRPE